MEIVYYRLNFLKSQTWGALYKCWIGFIIARKMGRDKIEIYG